MVMGNLSISMEELETTRDVVFEYLDGLEKEEDVNYAVQRAFHADNRFLMVSFIVNVFNQQIMPFIVDISEIPQDTFLDIISEQNKNPKE